MSGPIKPKLSERIEQAVGKLVEGVVAGVAEPTGASPNVATAIPPKVTTATVSVERIGNHAYAHGVYMGAAGAMLADPLWNGIFRALMPAQHQKAISFTNTSALIPYMENNPVMAAYGTARYLEAAGQPRGDANPAAHRTLPMEWDIWLDPSAPADLGRCRIAHGSSFTTTEQHLLTGSHIGLEMPDVAEAASARNWMNLFGRAITLYRVAGSAGQAGSASINEDAAIALCTSFMRAPSGLILDCKSTYSSPSDLNAFISALTHEYAIDVIGVGTFCHQQLADLTGAARRIKFFHGAAGVIRNARTGGRLCRGDRLMFNAGSLLREAPRDAAGVLSYKLDEQILIGLSEARERLDLAIGLYVQEVAAAPAALSIINTLVNQRPTLFLDGFAYGNLPGQAEAHAEGTGLGAQSTPALLEADGL
jgi:hypothetical protein